MSAVRCQSFTHLSRHARRRLQQRTSLVPLDLQSILDSGKYVDTGRKPGFDRHHLVFYSKKDDRCFVAIRDETCGTVVTILPLGYQSNLAWSVAAEDEQRARRLATGVVVERTVEQVPTSLTWKPFHISAAYVDGNGAYKVKLLAKVPSGPYRGDYRSLLRDDEVLSQLDDALSRIGIEPRAVVSVLVRIGNSGDPTVIDVHV